jgi:hypothetical protein
MSDEWRYHPNPPAGQAANSIAVRSVFAAYQKPAKQQIPGGGRQMTLWVVQKVQLSFL